MKVVKQLCDVFFLFNFFYYDIFYVIHPSAHTTVCWTIPLNTSGLSCRSFLGSIIQWMSSAALTSALAIKCAPL